MEYSSEANDRLWDAYLLANTARLRLERHAWRKSFLLVVALLAITLVGATVLARFGGPHGSIPIPNSDPQERITAQSTTGR